LRLIVLEALQSGAWLTPARARAYPLLLIGVYIAGIAAALVTAHGVIDTTGRPLGSDFSMLWAAGTSVQNGDPALSYDLARFAALQRQIFGADTPILGWHYPPYFLAVAAMVALLPYVWALLVWQAGTMALYAIAIYRILPDRWVLIAALGFPGVIINIGHGHNGFLTAFLLGGGLLALDRRPWVAGMFFALLAYKPQFAVVLPIALLADKRYVAMLSAAIGVALITLASVWAFGLQSWLAFRASMDFTRSVVLEQGSTGWQKIQSSFAAIRALGGSVGLAYAVQGVVTLLVVVAIAWLWHSKSNRRLQYAALITGAVLATPYVLDYDMVILAPALAFALSYARDLGFRPWQKTVMAVLYAAPLLTRMVAEATLVPLGLLAMLGFFAMVVWRAWSDLRAR
jgi:alpha-1,2-mannosyltransferase